ncbi:voltage-gated sodium channel [Gracilibacillus ureilyticus]|uniref:Voltage-gated sodium channel n=1 Tax=Gracilibacillus ureilyticus TaxID=531814 RepID=A0A1H9QQC0_9BACI|nr:ion transporter [Gracilibacillus ureilyticus]SER62638.1 voltage-gated sodium channel [Gracilibacillus ureilyticus]
MDKLHKIVMEKRFNRFITGLIIVNAILIGLETIPTIYSNYYSLFFIADIAILVIFTLEVLLKITVLRGKFFKNSWNIFDFVIVLGSVILYSTPYVSVLRIFRVLRVFRTITTVPTLRRIVAALFMAIPTISSVLLIMAIIFYVYAVLGTSFYRDISPEYFGDIFLSSVTLFQVFTLESWASGIFRPIFEQSPSSWLYFVSFIVITTFIMINLIVGEIVNNAQKLSENIEEETGEIKEEISEMKELRNEINELKQILLEKRN